MPRRTLRARGSRVLRLLIVATIAWSLSFTSPSRAVEPEAGSGLRRVSEDAPAVIGRASWYGNQFANRPTASGELFDPEKLTAAHRKLPLGTKVVVTNLHNGRSVMVTITDRGPFFPERDIDLSYGAARAIGMLRRGVARVRIEPL